MSIFPHRTYSDRLPQISYPASLTVVLIHNPRARGVSYYLLVGHHPSQRLRGSGSARRLSGSARGKISEYSADLDDNRGYKSSTSASKTHFSRHRRPMCDCGSPAVTIKLVKVGTNPQYTIRLPLCAACLKLEQELASDLE